MASFRLSVTVAVLLALVDSALSIGVFFPLYIYPGSATCSAWTSIISSVSANPKVTFYFVVNPASGPGVSGSQPDTTYQACIAKLKPAANPNVVILGYVPTTFGARSASAVNADIATYARWSAAYRPTGIFFDEVEATSGYSAQYKAFAKTVTGYSFFNFVVTNPGQTPDSSFYTFSNLVVSAETYYSSFSASSLTINSSSPANKQVVLLHDAPTAPSASLINTLSGDGVKAVYLTDATQAEGAYNYLPSQWTTFVKDVAATV